MLVFRGNIAHSTKEIPLEILEDRLIGVQNGKIVFVEESSKLNAIKSKFSFDSDCVKQLGPDEFLIPGLVDTHVHASQYPQTGTNLDLPLLEWLKEYTFPLESSYQDLNFAEMAYKKAVTKFLKNGTTTACYFATIHLEGTLKLCDVVESLGQRAYVGKLSMDQNSPSIYIEKSKQSITDTEKYIEAVLKRKNPLLTPVVTPRFAPTSTFQTLDDLGKLVNKYNVPVQSHISETRPEVQWVKELFPQCKNYADVYDKCGLLTDKTVMAHGIYLSTEELQVFKARGSGISHCPNSNISICSGLLDVRQALEHGVKVGLGTDVSGGYSPSILNAIRLTVHVSNIVSLDKDSNYKPVDFKEAFRLATLGGAEVLGLDEKIGNFEVGKEFDALRINVSVPDSPIDIFAKDRISDKVQKFIHLGDDRNITEIYVAGKSVLQRT